MHMTEVVGVKFRETGKIYYFSPSEIKIEKGTMVIVETSRGIECGEVVMSNSEVPDETIVQPLKNIIRVATPKDIERVGENRKKEKEAFEVCLQKIEKHQLEMKLIDVEYTFDNTKILFYFTADGRVDFRELVKDLASVFRVRIELRQIGVRDETKMMGGLGVCGREFCCKAFLDEFQPVSIKMAKEQSLSLNPVKISGACGRLMCCLKYEQGAYEHLLKKTPKVGAIINTPDGRGTVVENNLLTGMLKVKLDAFPDAAPSSYNRKQVKLVKDARIEVNASELAALKDIE